MAVAARTQPYARATEGGLATAFMGKGRAWPLAAGAVASFALAAGWRPLAGPVAVAAGGVAAAAVIAGARVRLGGFTGDVLGAAGVVGETVGPAGGGGPVVRRSVGSTADGRPGLPGRGRPGRSTAWLGEPPLRPHPVAVFGRTMRAVEGASTPTGARPAWPTPPPAWPSGAGAGRLVGVGSTAGATAAATYLAVAGRALADAGRRGGPSPGRGRLDQARRLLPALVGRDPSAWTTRRSPGPRWSQ